MSQPTRLAGGEYTIASCGHPIRPGDRYVADEQTGEVYCDRC